MPFSGDPGKNLVHMDFGPSAEGILDILPVQEEDLHRALKVILLEVWGKAYFTFAVSFGAVPFNFCS